MCPPLDTCDLKDDMERCLLANYILLIIERRCADWFFLGQIRVIGTNAGNIMCNYDEVITILRVYSNVAQSEEQTLQQILHL